MRLLTARWRGRRPGSHGRRVAVVRAASSTTETRHGVCEEMRGATLCESGRARGEEPTVMEYPPDSLRWAARSPLAPVGIGGCGVAARRRSRRRSTTSVTPHLLGDPGLESSATTSTPRGSKSSARRSRRRSRPREERAPPPGVPRQADGGPRGDRRSCAVHRAPGRGPDEEDPRGGRETLASTPPGSWALESEPEREERTRSEAATRWQPSRCRVALPGPEAASGRRPKGDQPVVLRTYGGRRPVPDWRRREDRTTANQPTQASCSPRLLRGRRCADLGLPDTRAAVQEGGWPWRRCPPRRPAGASSCFQNGNA